MQIIANTWIGTGTTRKLMIETHGDRIAQMIPENQARLRPDAIVCPPDSLLIPGLHDAHCHLLLGGFMLMECDFDGVESVEQFTDVLARYIREREIRPGEWIRGGRFDETRFRVTRHDIDRVCADSPVFIWTHDLHSALANTQALEAARIDQDTNDPPGGRFDRDEQGRLTGMLREPAAHLVEHAIPPPRPEQTRNALLKAQDHAFSRGITAVSSSVRRDHLAHYARFAGSAERKIRLNVWPVSENFRFEEDRFERVNATGYRVGTLKGFVDGALGSRSAAFYEPYDDTPGSSGMLVIEEGLLAEWIQAASEEHYQVALHAIGDRACSICLNALKRAGAAANPAELRPRVEHVQHLRKSDIPRFAELGVIASMQPIHSTADMRFVEPRLGKERAKSSYALRSLLDWGARLAFGSDWPVEDMNPVAGIAAAVTRQDANGNPPGGWQPQERIRADQALRAYTLGSAFAAFWEKDGGTIEEGKFADFTVLSRNVLTCKPEHIRETKALMTIVGGEIVFRDPDF
ncbi:amidohydrolase [bacterium]|nr:amidohydrolase [bacterium]